MEPEQTASGLMKALADGLRWLLEKPPDPVAHLDEATQRRLLLRWAKQHSEETLAEVRRKCPTPERFEHALREEVWGTLWVFWLGFPLFFVPGQLLKAVRLRRELGRHWQDWLASPDPDCDHWALEAEIRHHFDAMPRSLRKNLKDVKQELLRVSHTYQELGKKGAQIEVALRSLEGGATPRRAELAARLEGETDSVTAGSLQRQLTALDSQQELRNQLQSWQTRVRVAREECTEGLRHLRSQLAVLAASETQGLLAADQAISSLHTLNSGLTATLAATEEVAQLRVG